LSGSDYKVHLYSEDSITHVVQERDPHEFFPEFVHEFPSVALWIDFHIIPEKDMRCTSVGCECGTLFLYIVDIKSNAIIHNHSINLGSSMTSSKFFYMNQTLNLLVTNALLPACVYSNILSNGLSVSSILIGSEKQDIITCSLVCDIQMDQQPTILLGTYGQELLAYRYCSDSMWILAWQRSFSHPILSLDYCDVTGDGVRELVALTTRGVQILQVR
jgi:KICSTOR complex protein kaptin